MRWTGRFAGYDTASFRKDLLSGLIVGIIAIPLGMAFAIASGVKPEYGIYTTIIAGVLISLCGGSRYQIGGPTGAFVPILFAITMQYGYENLLLAGFLSGIILVIMGLFKAGTLIKYMPKPVTIGFTSGIAVIIFTGQLPNLLGLRNIEKHESFLFNLAEIFKHLTSINVFSLATAAICLAVVLLSQRYLPKLPGSLTGMLISSAAAALFFNGHVDTIGSVFGDIPGTLPHLHFPELTLQRIEQLIFPAIVIAMLGGIESLLSAVVADNMSAKRHNSNRELIGQGIANLVTPLFGGIPATGAIARTATNVKYGAVSPISGIMHSIVVFLVFIFFSRYASHIPLASMAPILIIVAWNMSERKPFIYILKSKTSDSAVLLLTFLLTVLTNLSTAVAAGLLLSVILFLKRMSTAFMVTSCHDYPQISICIIKGPLFFGAADRFENLVMNTINEKSKVLLLRMEKVPFMDTSGESKLNSLVKHFRKYGVTVMISEIQSQPLEVLKRGEIYRFIGQEHFFQHSDQAIDYALNQLEYRSSL
ncbi:SulP family inorganic anion transporter [Paenibacillus sp. Soil522]|uniref:SulP family inorganic anion transporter n=1 Tax=Paenibacillus sp. Soil522 TaxID=1736388 RepID=UPI0006FBC99B|nr:SulP family inorganic anion transporter [Paenibacillus sp. Soil522]KRE32675.1 sulfate transporter [Paenibacillus sp. Soil522]